MILVFLQPKKVVLFWLVLHYLSPPPPLTFSISLNFVWRLSLSFNAKFSEQFYFSLSSLDLSHHGGFLVSCSSSTWFWWPRGNHGVMACGTCAHTRVRFPSAAPNEAPSDVNTMLDGSTYPGWKMCRFNFWFFFFLRIKTQQAISGTSAATYKVMEPHC